MPSVDRPTPEGPEQAKGAGAKATRAAIIDAARARLLEAGIARMSTRSVADAAGVPLSQLHYHFGSKQRLILDVLEAEDARRIDRQTSMYAEGRPLWQRYEQACDFLDDDIETGYVHVLQEMIAAGWSDAAIGQRVRELLQGWIDLLIEVVKEAEDAFGPFGPFRPDELAALIGQAFLGGEALLLLGFDREQWPVKSSLRRIGVLIRDLEEGGGSDARARA